MREGEVVREGEGGVEGMGKLRLMVRVRVSHDNSSGKRSKKCFFDEYDNMGVGCDFGQ